MATRPQTIGYALLDSPVALAAWMIDHDTDAYYKIARAFVDGQPSGNLTRDHVLDNITAYWLTGTGASAARSYWEAYGPDAPAAGRQPLPPPPIPVGFTTFPGEIWRTPRSWVETSVPQRHLLQRGRQGRPLRRLGRAGALLDRGAGGFQVIALIGACERRVRKGARRSRLVGLETTDGAPAPAALARISRLQLGRRRRDPAGAGRRALFASATRTQINRLAGR